MIVICSYVVTLMLLQCASSATPSPGDGDDQWKNLWLGRLASCSFLHLHNQLFQFT